MCAHTASYSVRERPLLSPCRHLCDLTELYASLASICVSGVNVGMQVLGHQNGVALVEGLSDCAPVGALVQFSNGAKGYVSQGFLVVMSSVRICRSRNHFRFCSM